MGIWELSEATTHFNELVEEAQTEGAQFLMKDDSAIAVVLSMADYRCLRAANLSARRPDGR
jgi:hypothetical protein